MQLCSLAQDLTQHSVQVELVGGLDTSYATADACQRAVATYVLLRLADPRILATLHERIHVTVPYVSGYLAFREVPAYQRLLSQAKQQGSQAQVHISALIVRQQGRVRPCRLPSISCVQDQQVCKLRSGHSVQLTCMCCAAGGDGGRLWGAASPWLWCGQPPGGAHAAAHDRRGQEPPAVGSWAF